MTIFKTKTIQKIEYNLTHLEPFSFDLLVDGMTFKVGVEFGCHCFTETLTLKHAPDFHYQHNGDKRAFSIERHALSHSLPNFIRTLGSRAVYHSEQGNFFFLRDVISPQQTTPYLVFFDVFKAKKTNVRILVRSAYLKPNMSRIAAPVKFSNLVVAIATGKKLPLGPRQQIKRR